MAQLTPIDHSHLEEPISYGDVVYWYEAGADLAAILTSDHLLEYFRQHQVHTSDPTLQTGFA